MTEIVASVERVTGIMSEISGAALEQTAGIEQINEAVGQMDAVTQQNAALVEQSAAASETMREQAVSLANAVAVFRVEVAGHSQGTSRPVKTGRAVTLLAA
jgi:methyl-accepting chemotaxis protein